MTRALRLPAWTAVFLAAALLLWPALIAGRPSVFDDTDGYYWLGESLAEAGLQTLLSLFGDDRPIVAEASLFAPGGVQYLSWMGARSPSYALFLFAGERVGTLWLVVYLQALAAAWMIRALLLAVAPSAGARAFLGLVAALSATTALPFYATFAMPDLFAAVAATAMVLLLAFPDRLSRPAHLAVWLLLAVSLTFHRSHLLVAMALLAAVFAVLMLRHGRRVAVRRCAGAAGATAAALAALLIYPLVVRALPGPAELRDPPFLTARVLADGPGRSYLAHACAHGVDYALCGLRDAAMTDSEDILWSQEPGYAVVARADPQTRARLKAEEPAFVLGTLRHAPGAVALAAIRNVALQLGRFQVAEPLESPVQYLRRGHSAIAAILPGAETCLRAPDRCGPAFDVGLLRWFHVAVVGLGLAVLAVCAHRLGGAAVLKSPPGPSAGPAARMIYAAALVLGFVAFNAAFCGVLSVAMPRYGARLIWLIPALAGAFAIALAHRRPAGVPILSAVSTALGSAIPTKR